MSYFFKRFISSREYPGIKLIIFDFDGTLADTRELLLRIIKKHLLGFEISLTKDLIRFFGNAPLETYISMTGIPKELVRSVCIGIHKDFIKEYHKIRPCKNFSSIKEIDVRKVIVSNNMTFFIEKSLNFLKGNFFDGVYGADKFKDKVSMIGQLRKKYKLDLTEILYVGDKDIDVDVARNAGVYSAVISNKSSWSSKKEIIKKKPDYLVTDLSKIAEVVRQINSEKLSSI